MFNATMRKLLTILFLGAVLAVALQLIHAIVVERQSRQLEVEAGIAAGIGGRQTIVGPLLIVHWREPVPNVVTMPGAAPFVAAEPRLRIIPLLPDTLEANGEIAIQPRYRGIYRAQTYRLDGVWRGRFNVPARYGIGANRPGQIERVSIAFGVSDPRGLRGRPEFRVDGRVVPLLAGTSIPALADGFRVELEPAALLAGGELGFSLEFSLEGTAGLSVVPSGDDTRMALRSNWPHPAFEGAFLPGEKTIAADGFSARWQTTLLATNLGSRLSACVGDGAKACDLPGVAVRFVEPVNVYQRSERAVKYGLLFIALTFAALFLFETLKQWRLHPLQYGFVGAALSLFFLLVISLSEHIAFGIAYGAATLACVTLITGYLRYVLGGWRLALVFGALFFALYGVLYGLLLSEDNALVLGALLLFTLLAVAMWLTRRVDWYTAPSSQQQA
ncbi:MAG: cell envelope integrity protein CreD [Betaproteobacteria bacterium]